MQKKIYDFKLLLMLPFMMALLSSCSSSSNNNDEDGGKEDQINVVGVWSDGKHFLSVNSDKFLTSYVAPNFIDCGNIIENGKEITCHNVYFNKNTTYKILSIDRSKLNISVSYKDIAGESKSANLILNKVSDTPATSNHTLVGKNYTYRTSYIGNVNIAFSTYSIAQMTSTSYNCAKYPITLFYIFMNDNIYFQKFTQKGIQVPTIGGWTTDVDDGSVTVYKLSFGPDGSVVGHDVVTNDAL